MCTEYAPLYQFLISLFVGFLVSLVYLHNNDAQQADFPNWMNNLFNLNKERKDDLFCEEATVQNALRTENRLLCLITTSIHRLQRQRALLDTWAARCDVTLFILGRKKAVTTRKLSSSESRTEPVTTSTTDSNKARTTASTTSTKFPKGPCIDFEVEHLTPNIRVVHFDMVDVYENLWQKTKLAFRYIVDEEEFDWVLKVDDDSYILVENLRLFISKKDPEGPAYYGFHYKTGAPNGFNSGGSGYVMSWQNAAKFVQLLRRAINGSSCPRRLDAGPEDVYIAQCLADLSIYPDETRDEEGRHRFMPIQLSSAISRIGVPNWFRGLVLHPLKEGLDCCSDAAISLHYVSPEVMRVFEYLAYYLHPFSSRTLWRVQSIEDKVLFDRYYISTSNTATAGLTTSRRQGCLDIGTKFAFFLACATWLALLNLSNTPAFYCGTLYQKTSP